MHMTSEQLRIEIKATADALGIAPSTVGERAGQGGRFYTRLCEGRRVWPETAAAVMKKIDEMRADHKRGNADAACQAGDAA